MLDIIDNDLINRSPLPKAWAIKYFIAASASWLVWEDVNKGIKDIKFNSNPIQIKIQWFPLSARIDPKIKVEENNVIKGNEDI